jgi:hypothetical protein
MKTDSTFWYVATMLSRVVWVAIGAAALAVVLGNWFLGHFYDVDALEMFDCTTAALLPGTSPVMTFVRRASFLVAGSLMLNLLLLVRQFLHRRADVLHNRGADLIDKRKRK